VLEHPRYQQVALLDALATLALDETSGPTQPSTRAPHLAPLGEVHADPECAAGCLQRLAGIQVRLVRVPERAEVVVLATDHVGGRCEQLEIVG
jgi:hypothetical protein